MLPDVRPRRPRADTEDSEQIGISVWGHLLLEKFYLHRPLERTVAALELHGLPLSPGTLTGGLQRIEPMFESVYQALVARQVASDFSQADETRWMVFVKREGKQGYRWWLWVFLSGEAVVFRPARSRPSLNWSDAGWAWLPAFPTRRAALRRRPPSASPAVAVGSANHRLRCRLFH